MADDRTKRIGKKGGVRMTAPPGRELPKKGGRKPAGVRISSGGALSGGAQTLGNGRASSSSAPTGQTLGNGRAPTAAPAAQKREAAAPPEGERPKSEAVKRMESEADARAKRLAALEKRAADSETRQRLSEFECAICYEDFKSKANPDGRHRVACLPCGHAMYCDVCATDFKRCPSGCDGPFRGVVKLYL